MTGVFKLCQKTALEICISEACRDQCAKSTAKSGSVKALCTVPR